MKNNKIKKTKLFKNVPAARYMPNTKQEKQTRENNSNNNSIENKGKKLRNK